MLCGTAGLPTPSGPSGSRGPDVRAGAVQPHSNSAAYDLKLLEHHAAFEPLLADRMTIVHLGREVDVDLGALFAELAGCGLRL
jgi:hypothetical protein